jgi:bifunctional enzyme CysN/CysC
VPHVVLAVNKMDLVDYSQDVYESIRDEFVSFATKLNVPDLVVIPISALLGDNIVTRSANTPWYDGPSLLHHLENLHVASDRNLIDTRFPVQYVIRPQSSQHLDYRGYAGTVASGVLKPGDEVMVLPSGFTTTISAIDTPDGPVDEAFPPMSVAVRLADEIDISRGDMLCRPHNAPTPAQNIDAMVCWMTERPLQPRQKLVVKHTTRSARAMVKDVQYRLDVNTLHRDEAAGQLGLNDVGRVQLRTMQPLMVDPYQRNRATGGFILVDEATNTTVGAGMVTAAS